MRWRPKPRHPDWVPGNRVRLLENGEAYFPAVFDAIARAERRGGLGVIEGIFIAVLGSEAARSGLIAALLAYRVLYYLVPLAIATVLYFTVEATHRNHRSSAESLV